MKKNLTRFIVEVSILASLGLIFDLLSSEFLGFAWLNGGSINIACIPIFIATYKHNLKGGLLCGLLIGTVQLFWAKASYLINIFQILLDYIIPYVALGFGIWVFCKKDLNKIENNIHIALGLTLGFSIKILCNTLSGIWFYEVLPKASLIYNIPYNVISLLACIIICIPLSYNKAIMK